MRARDADPVAVRVDWPPLVNVADQALQGRTGEAWRAECEARRVLALHTLRERREYLARVEKRRGEASRRELEALILAVFHARRGTA